MEKEMQDYVWAILPNGFKKEVKEAYKTPYNSIHDLGYNHALDYFFGEHNLTSDTETEEMLIISRKAAEELYNKYLGDALQAVSRITLRKDINILFGGKCRVGEDDIVVNKTEPKFNVGDKVLISDDPRIGRNFRGCIGTVAFINSTDQCTVDVGNGVFDCFHISHLAPYIEPKQENTLFSENAKNENNGNHIVGSEHKLQNEREVECPKPIGYLEHKPTKSMISVYTPISWFRKFMMRWCFGLTYHKR